MVKIRTAKSKGSSHEYDCQESLQPSYQDIYRTSERGFQMQYDLRSDIHKSVFECKRLAGISWNQAVAYYKKLESVAPDNYLCFLLFRSNRQPCLVMTREGNSLVVKPFNDYFGLEFKKHNSTRQ